jgi:hypothetical protein
MLEFLELGLGKVFHLTVQELLRISTFSKVKDTPLIGILKDEPFTSSHGFIVLISFHHMQPSFYASFPGPAQPPG